MESLIIFIIGFLAGITILGYWELRKEEKNHDRDYKNTQGNRRRRFWTLFSLYERGAESSVPGSSDNGEFFDITKELALYSRNVLTQSATARQL